MSAFIPDLPVIIAFALAAFVLAITPGPDMALFVSRTINWGRAHAYIAMFGAAIGILLHAILAALGLSVLLAASPTAFFVVKIAGAAYLLFLAIQAVRSGGGLTLRRAAAKEPTYKASFLTGLGSNLTNPKVILFFVTFLPQFISRTDPFASGKLIFFGLEFLLIGVPINIGCVLAAHWIADSLARSVLIRRALNWSFAAVFAGFAATILFIEGRH